MGHTDKDHNSNEVADAFIEINRLADLGKLKKALTLCEDLYKKYPANPRVLHGFGLLKYRTGDPETGERLIRNAIDLKPEYLDAYFHLGRILHNSVRFKEAEEAYRKSLSLAPDDVKYVLALAFLLTHQGEYTEAHELCNKAMEKVPGDPSAYAQLGNIMLALGRTVEAVANFRKSLSIARNSMVHSCLLFAINLLPDVSQQEIFNESKCWAKRYLSKFEKLVRRHLNRPDPEKKIRIGYVSGDFRAHPVGYHLRPVLANHNKEQVFVCLYNSCHKVEEMTEEFFGYADCYRDISLLSDEQAEVIIRKDGIDILVDLAGHTGFNRLTLFARRPAPVQMSWIGYFNTTGMQSIDYHVSDEITAPPYMENFFSEKILRLPNCRFCYQAQPYTPDVAPLPFKRNSYITFGSFNNITKISNNVVELWSKIMHGVPGSKLLLKAKSFSDPDVVQDFRERFARHSITAERIEMRALSPHAEMLAEYGDVDIALDTFPFNGGATTCEALWMGVPVVTLVGNIPIHRQSKAFLDVIGFSDLVAETKDEFCDIALSLANNIERLDSIRGQLRAAMAASPLCNGSEFTENLENTFRHVWSLWCADNREKISGYEDIRRFNIDEILSFAVISMNDGDYERASMLFEAVLKKKPSHTVAALNLGNCLLIRGLTDYAAVMFRKVLRYDKTSFIASLKLAIIYGERGNLRTSFVMAKKALSLEPDNLEVLYLAGNLCRHMGRLTEASAYFEKALIADSAHVDTYRMLSKVYQGLGKIEKAEEMLGKALEIDPNNTSVMSAHLALLSYQDLPQNKIYELSLKYGSRFVSETNSSASALKTESRHLRIGFVSPDFVSHPVGFLLRPFFKNYNASTLSLYCYFSGRGQDALTQWFKSVVAGWRDISEFDDETAASVIRADNIDILIDLSGHTIDNRLSLFALRPAPVQATWLGYWNTTGIEAIDYIIADYDLVKNGEEHLFSEHVLRLPYSRFCYEPQTPYPEVVEPPCIDNGYITFGCFNDPVKINEQVVTLWSNVLKSVPGSRLVLKWRTYQDFAVRQNVRDRFKARGVSPKRIEFRTQSNMYMMMIEYGDIDIALDSFPFTGGMTTLHALWMGVPVITLTGEQPISRQTYSFLNLLGLNMLVASSESGYVAIAKALANDLDTLVELREKIRELMKASPLCDANKFATSLENAFFTMWNEYRLKNNGVLL